MNGSTIQKLAAYATIKGMTDSEKYKNQYFILAEFIKYLIVVKRLRGFSISKVMVLLQDEFDFDIPYAVVRAALNRIDELSHVKDDYTVVSKIEAAEDFIGINQKAEQDSKSVITKLVDFANRNDDSIKLDLLEKEFVRYVLDKRSIKENKYNELISKFFLSVENDDGIQESIEQIREGNILYCGLNYNIIDIGSITEDLTLYLDTEVLFMLAGYDGELNKKVACDLTNLVRRANQRGTKIKLSYFDQVREEIDRFFSYACRVVSGKAVASSRAMLSIVNGCDNESDVLDKQSDFYIDMNNLYGIRCDEHKDHYYDEDKHPFNLESIEDAKEDVDTQEAIQFISYINILREGEQFTDYTKSKHIIVTETRRLQEVSDQIREQGKCGYSLPLSKITNILWVKLGSEFGEKAYPYNAKIAVKARLILDRSIAANVSKTYAVALGKYKAGELTEEKTAARILRLQEKLTEPENISSANVDDLLDFSAESVQKYEDAIESGKRIEDAKNAVITALKADKESKDSRIADLEKAAKDKDQTIEEQKKTIQAYEERDKKNAEKKSGREETVRRVLNVFAIIILCFIVYWSFAFLPEMHLIRVIGRALTVIICFYEAITTIFPQFDLLKRLRKGTSSEKQKQEEKKQWPIKIWVIVDIILLISTIALVFFTNRGQIAENKQEAIEEVQTESVQENESE